MGDKKLADRFGESKPYHVKTDDVVGVYARKSGYYEFIVAKPKGGLKALELRAAKRPSPNKKIGSFNLQFDVKNARAARWALEHSGWLIKEVSKTTRERVQEAVARAQISGDLDKQYEDILAAVGDEARAEVIARTESMTAANAGQREGWDQAVEAGLLPEDATVSWIATDVDPCPECEALDGVSRTLDGEYPSGEFPPLHPNCRCTEGISGF
jgi:SPP1 gp7 family putative phage head morphogenesis protein